MIKKSVISTAEIVVKDDMPFVICSVCNSNVSVADAVQIVNLWVCYDCCEQIKSGNNT